MAPPLWEIWCRTRPGEWDVAECLFRWLFLSVLYSSQSIHLFKQNMCLLPFNGFVLSFARVLSCYGLWRTCISVATLGIRWLRILYRWVIPECKDPGENFAISIQITSYHVKTKYLMSYMFVHTVSDRCVSCQFKRHQSVSLQTCVFRVGARSAGC